MIRSILAGVLKGVVSQRLLPMADGGRIAAVEVMVVNDRIAELIRESRSEDIPAAITRRRLLRHADADAGAARPHDPTGSSTARRRRTPRRTPTTSRSPSLALEKELAAEGAPRRPAAEPGRGRRRTPPSSSLRCGARLQRHGSSRRARLMNGAVRRARVPARARDRELPERGRRARARTALDRRAGLELPVVPRRRSPGTTTSRSSPTCCCAGAAAAARRTSRSKYPLVELTTALLVSACFLDFGVTADAARLGVLLRHARRRSPSPTSSGA